MTKEWNELEFSDKWIYDKLLLAVSQNHYCGPAYSPIERHGDYVTKPITNLSGMGKGSQYHYHILPGTILDIPPGHFWVQRFCGTHLSVDYLAGIPSLILRGEKKFGEINKFTDWIRQPLSSAPRLSEQFQRLINKYERFNVEFIDGQVIEMHHRVGGDSWIFKDVNVSHIEVVWNDRPSLQSSPNFIQSFEQISPYTSRLGFLINP